MYGPDSSPGHQEVIDIRHVQDAGIDAVVYVTGASDWKKEMLQQVVTAEGIRLVLDKKTGLYSYSRPSLNRIDPPSRRLRAYAKRRKSSNPLSYLWHLFSSWFWEKPD